MIKKVCVYCSSSSKIDKQYIEAGKDLGRILAKHNLELVYGGGSVGLMGVLADTVLENGGKVIGVIPEFMCEVEWQHNGISELILTKNMHERKEKMAQMTDAIVALPGGCGTLEELLEIITWKQLGIHSLPIVIVNTNNYYKHLIAQLQQSADEMFMRPEHLKMWQVVNSPKELIEAINNQENVFQDMRRFAKI
jgi:uncharacterized protein (TIGR00730 family)